jgi:AcrR family transcriptional regulator
VARSPSNAKGSARRTRSAAPAPPHGATRGDGAARGDGEAPSGGAPAQGRELRARGQRTLRKLLDAGIQVFAARGYHAARVDDVVKLAKTSHGTFYLYFTNKEDLCRALTAEVADDMHALAEGLGPLRAGDAGRAELQEWIGRFADLYDHYGSVIRAWTEAEISSDELGRLGEDVLARFTRVLTDRITQVAPADLDPVVAALAIVAMLERLNYYVGSGQVAIDRRRMVATLARVTHAAIFGGAPARR